MKCHEAASGRIKEDQKFGSGCLTSQVLGQAAFSTVDVGKVTFVSVLMLVHNRVRIMQKFVLHSVRIFVLSGALHETAFKHHQNGIGQHHSSGEKSYFQDRSEK